MKKFYTIKPVSILFVFCMLALCSAFCYAKTTVNSKTVNFKIDFKESFKDPSVSHVQISSVVANGILNAKVIANFGYCRYADAYLEYNFDSDTSTTFESIKKENINADTPFYVGTEKDVIKEAAKSGKGTIYYRVKVIFKSEEKGDFEKYAPEGASENKFVAASIVSKIEQTINGTDGGSIEVESGDQSKGDSSNIKVTVPEGAYSGSGKVIVNFIDDTEVLSAPKLVSSSVKESVISTVSVEVDGVSELDKPIQIDNLPLQKQTSAKKFVMQYQNSSDWENTTDTNLNVDNVNQVFSFSAGKLGYYRVLENITLTDSSYRPQNRIIIKSRIPDRYPGFEFNNLKEGDTVSIYNPKGKRIAKLTSGDSKGFVWKGKKGTDNSGDWAKSGIYIYQIKIKETGKLISGTIVFVY